MLMGSTAISEKKLCAGNPLVVLGVEIRLLSSGVVFKPAEEKLRKWTMRISKALEEGRLCAGEASKLGGALQWAAQMTFRRLGRAMVRPITKQGHSYNSTMNKELRWALQWWLEVFKMNIVEERLWDMCSMPPIHLFCDARSTPPRIAAVLFRQVYLSL